LSSANLRIALIAPLWTKIPPATYGGIELMVGLLADELVARGHEVTLFASGDSVTRARLQPVCEVHILELMKRGLVSDYSYYANGAVAEALARANEFDVLHFHIGCEWFALGAASKTPALFTIHTHPGPEEEWAFSRYRNVAAAGISRYQIAALESKCQRQIPVVYNGIDFDAFQPRYDRGNYLAYLGRMSAAKNPVGAIEIARQCGLPIVMAGVPQSAQEEIYFKENVVPQIDGREVVYLGAADHRQKEKLLSEAAALLFPIQWAEPFGLVMIEAMACGTPVVACRMGSVEEVIDEGVTGFSSASLEDLAGLTMKALELDRRKVREFARERFGYGRMTDEYLRVYEILRKR
jgi:glycosyltransferase involved in cell wall biosynthesis